MAQPDIILHHYDTSPFSEKVRVMLGIKGLSWRSVIQPVIMPKPELIPLTGGYRRIPVLQIGADVYCDSQVIMAEIAERAGGAPLEGAGWAVNLWADRLFFQSAVPIIFGEIEVPKAFIEDREKLSGRPRVLGWSGPTWSHPGPKPGIARALRWVGVFSRGGVL